MEQLLKLALLSLLCLVSCGQGDVDTYAVRDSVRRQMESFPNPACKTSTSHSSRTVSVPDI